MSSSVVTKDRSRRVSFGSDGSFSPSTVRSTSEDSSSCTVDAIPMTLGFRSLSRRSTTCPRCAFAIASSTIVVATTMGSLRFSCLRVVKLAATCDIFDTSCCDRCASASPCNTHAGIVPLPPPSVRCSSLFLFSKNLIGSSFSIVTHSLPQVVSDLSFRDPKVGTDQFLGHTMIA